MRSQAYPSPETWCQERLCCNRASNPRPTAPAPAPISLQHSPARGAWMYIARPSVLTPPSPRDCARACPCHLRILRSYEPSLITPERPTARRREFSRTSGISGTQHHHSSEGDSATPSQRPNSLRLTEGTGKSGLGCWIAAKPELRHGARSYQRGRGICPPCSTLFPYVLAARIGTFGGMRIFKPKIYS